MESSTHPNFNQRIECLFSKPVYTTEDYTNGLSLVPRYENSRKELLVYDNETISLVNKGSVVNQRTGGAVCGSNDFLGCVYAQAFKKPHLVAVEKENLVTYPTAISYRTTTS